MQTNLVKKMLYKEKMIELFIVEEIYYEGDNRKYRPLKYTVLVEDEFITTTNNDVFIFKEELFNFNKGDNQNKIAKLRRRTFEGEKVVSLEIMLKNKKSVYLSLSESQSISFQLNALIEKRNIKNLIEFSLDEWKIFWDRHERDFCSE